MRKLMLFALPFGIGTALCQYLLPHEWQSWAATAALLVGLALAWLWKKNRLSAALVSFGLAAGMLWYSGYFNLFLDPAEKLVGTEDAVTLELLDYAEERDYGTRCTVRVLDRGLRGKAVYYGGGELLALEPGSRITVSVKYYSATVVGQRESTYYTAKGVFLRLYDRDEGVTAESGIAGSLRCLPQRMARRLRESIDNTFDEQTAALVTALLTGEREDLDQQTLTDFEETGLMHITAVSGLHCGFLIGLLGLLVGRRRRLTALLGYPILLFYMVMVGCSPSVVRACVMVGFLLFAPLVGREGDLPTSMSAAALVILLANPFAVASISFQMSFAAVIGIQLVTPRLYAAIGGGKAWKSRVVTVAWSFFAATLSASVGTMLLTAPLSAVYFGSIPLVSPVANLMVLWAAPFLFGSAFLLAVLCIPWPGLSALAAGPELLATYVRWTAGTLAKLPGSGIYFKNISITLWLLLVYAMLLLCWFTGKGRRKYVLAAALALATLLAARAVPALTAESGELTVVAVDVGQGAATLLHSGGATALVDCGSLYTPGGAGGAVADVMASCGWDKLDYVVLTHYHEDHAGGLEQLLTRVEVEALFLPQLLGSEDQADLQREVLDLAGQYGVPVTYIETPTRAELDGAVLSVYPPLTEGGTNEEGLTILCTSGNFDVLITGDMNSSTEKLLVETYDLPDIEVLMVGHHGSKYSTSEELLDALTPEIGVISVGENTYGHPTAEAMERMTERGMELYRTDLQGDVMIRLYDTGAEE